MENNYQKFKNLILLCLVLGCLSSCDWLFNRMPQDGELSMTCELKTIGNSGEKLKAKINDSNPFYEFAINFKSEDDSGKAFYFADSLNVAALFHSKDAKKVNSKLLTVTNTTDSTVKIIALLYGGAKDFDIIGENYEALELSFDDLAYALRTAHTEAELGELYNMLASKGYPYLKELKKDESWTIDWKAMQK